MQKKNYFRWKMLILAVYFHKYCKIIINFCLDSLRNYIPFNCHIIAHSDEFMQSSDIPHFQVLIPDSFLPSY